jgi:hypothetical protein
MYIIGAIIFGIYMYFTIWNIYNSNQKDKN